MASFLKFMDKVSSKPRKKKHNRKIAIFRVLENLNIILNFEKSLKNLLHFSILKYINLEIENLSFFFESIFQQASQSQLTKLISAQILLFSHNAWDII